MTSTMQQRLFALLFVLTLLLGSTSMHAQEQVRVTFTGFVQAIAQYGSESDYITPQLLTTSLPRGWGYVVDELRL